MNVKELVRRLELNHKSKDKIFVSLAGHVIPVEELLRPCETRDGMVVLKMGEDDLDSQIHGWLDDWARSVVAAGEGGDSGHALALCLCAMLRHARRDTR